MTWWAPDPDLPGKFVYHLLLALEIQEKLDGMSDNMQDCRLERTDAGGIVWKRCHMSNKRWWAPNPCQPHWFIWDPPWPTEKDATHEMQQDMDNEEQEME